MIQNLRTATSRTEQFAILAVLRLYIECLPISELCRLIQGDNSEIVKSLARFMQNPTILVSAPHNVPVILLGWDHSFKRFACLTESTWIPTKNERIGTLHRVAEATTNHLQKNEHRHGQLGEWHLVDESRARSSNFLWFFFWQNHEMWLDFNKIEKSVVFATVSKADFSKQCYGTARRVKLKGRYEKYIQTLCPIDELL